MHQSGPALRRAGTSALALVSLFALALAASSCGTGGGLGRARLQRWPQPAWSRAALGHVYMSSPTTARVGAIDVVAIGTERGIVEVLDAATGKELHGWPRRVARAPGQAAAIESSPTIAWLDGPQRPPTIIVGTGSTSVDDGKGVGEVEAFRFDGTRRFVFRVRRNIPGTAVGVVSSPAVGDITGNGRLDVVFGSWDHRLYALTASGRLVPGFPVDNQDTIWSSPALYHVRGRPGLDDVFIGSDASGRKHCFGGFLTDYTYRHRSPHVVWQHCERQTIWSSPAVGTINASGRPVVVVGTGFGETTYRRGSAELLAYYAATGAKVPGWPVPTTGPTPGSPAIGLDADGRPIVVATSWNCDGRHEASCFFRNDSTVLEVGGDGSILGSVRIAGATALSSPVLVPLTRQPGDDILVGAASGLYAIATAPADPPPHRGRLHLRYLYGVREARTITNQCPVNNSVALADIPGRAPSDGWYVIEACGGPVALHLQARLVGYRLPVQPRASLAVWPEFHDTPEHLGVAGDPAPGDPVPASRP